ncbi:hypothetical protein [Anaerosinus massiliensis]|uniref:hypothetical protein n=1 Tax=Massilibacillus massiliensis TaxID=1806837 RepID=UPI000DA6195B|nr:hypothetical protein [Massilibacillus massiliensis]
MDIAYSLEYEDIIDAEKAYDLYWSGFITDKKLFECPEPNCSGQMTCANIDKPRFLMKRDPYFTPGEGHQCDFFRGKNKKSSYVKDDRIGLRNKYIDTQVDIFLFDKPKKKSLGKDVGLNLGDKHKRMKKRQYLERDDNDVRNSKYNTIKPLISKFERYIRENLLDKRFINIVGNNIPYSQMFVNIEGLDFSQVNQYDRIYFGEATIVKTPLKSNDFIIKFVGNIIKDGERLHPSIYIANAIIQKHWRKNTWSDMLNDLVRARQKIIFYIYSKPTVNGDKNQYLNFQITNLNYLDYRIVE